MHPAGIKFGLAHGLLEFSGASVVLSPPLLESIWEMARRKVGESLGLIKQLLAEYSPEDMRHAELLALCQLDNWDRSPNKVTIEDFLR